MIKTKTNMFGYKAYCTFGHEILEKIENLTLSVTEIEVTRPLYSFW